jgi:hypothetical protein
MKTGRAFVYDNSMRANIVGSLGNYSMAGCGRFCRYLAWTLCSDISDSPRCALATSFIPCFLHTLQRESRESSLEELWSGELFGSLLR